MVDGPDLDVILDRLVAMAVELVSARYGPISVADANGTVRALSAESPVAAGPVRFTESDEPMLRALATAAGVAMQSAQLSEQSRRQMRWSEATSEIITQLLAGSDPGDALQAIADRTLELSSADHTLIAVPEDARLPPGAQAALIVGASAGFGTSSLAALTIPVIGSTVGAVFVDQVPRSVPGLDFDPAPGSGFELGPALMLPLRAGDRVLGVLVAARSAGASMFDSHELTVITSFADQAALALQLASNQVHLRELEVLADRDRIARDLHDHVIQRLFGVGLSLQGTQRRVVLPDVAQRIGDSIDQLHEIVSEIRTAIFDLHAGTSGKPRLRQRLHSAVTEMTRNAAPHTSVRLVGPLDLVPVDLAEHAEAVVREAVSNAIRHAYAKNLSVVVSVRDDLVIEVTDDGVGVSESIVYSGLANLGQRAENVGGQFAVEPGESSGTKIRWSAPLP